MTSMSCHLVFWSVMSLGEVAGLAVDSHADEPCAPGVLEDLLVLALAATHHGGQNLDAGAVGQVDDGVDHLLDGLALDGAAAGVAVGMSDAGEEEAEVVVDLRDGADGGARVAGDALLVDGDGGREALYVVDLRLVHASEELARVGGQRLDVAALSLGVDRVEGEGALAGAGHAGYHHELVARDGDVDVLEVVLASAANDDVF